MSSNALVSVAVVGLGFGEAFVPIYLSHPDVKRVVLVDQDEHRLKEVGDRFCVPHRFTSLEAALESELFDAVHLTTPVGFHAEQSIAVLSAGLHCACAVPMATTLDDIDAVLAAQRTSGANYMMMETSVYAREYFFARELYEKGALGELTFYRGFHMQDLDGYPPYWTGYPPMKYSTHALAPILALTGSTVSRVACLGSGRLSAERRGEYANHYPLETGLFQLNGVDAVAEITVSFSQVARGYVEGFSLYGSEMGLEWPQREGDGLQVMSLRSLASGTRGRHGGRLVDVETVMPADMNDGLPPEIAPYTAGTSFKPPNGGASVEVAAGHGGSHPYLVHEFVRSIVESRPSAVNGSVAASWSAPGICAHASAMEGGTFSEVPQYV